MNPRWKRLKQYNIHSFMKSLRRIFDFLADTRIINGEEEQI